MKTYFEVSDSLGFGKGTSLTEAFENYNSHNRRMHKGQNYWLRIVQAEKMEDFGFSQDSLNTFIKNGASEIIVSLEKF